MVSNPPIKRARPDVIILIATLFLVSLGTVMVYSSSSIVSLERFGDEYFFLKKQILFVIIGIVAMIVMTKIPYLLWRKTAYAGMLVSIGLLSLLLVPGFGVKVGGATRWLRVCGFSFQVAELVKVALVVFLAHYLAKKKEHIREFLRIFPVPLFLTFAMVCLIMLQPDFGTAVIIVILLMFMFYLAGSRIFHLAGLVAACIPVAVTLVICESYRIQRLLSFRNPWEDPTRSGFQIIQSFISFGSGGAFGVGLGDSMQKLFYLPEPHTDFILSVIAEEIGFIGVAVVILLFSLLIIRGFMISFNTPELFGTLLSAGLTIIIALEAFINMAAVMGLVPTKGLALPFLSYGGTSMIMSMTAVGILLNISSYHNPDTKSGIFEAFDK
ncbi:MAG: putative lipid II flippase FtsW [Thermodesulfobacteriota bacterium]|nr:putative lipid II flippase FtsW [Thermodesulfobacteriota bacterium]